LKHEEKQVLSYE